MSHPERPVRLRYLLKPREETGQSHREVLSVYREHGVVPKSSRDDNFNKTPTDLSRFQVVHVGDLVVNKMKAWQGSIAVSRYGGIVSPDYLVCSVSPDIHVPYLHYLLRSNHLINEFRIRSKGIRPAQWRLYWEDLAEIRVQLPHLDKQRHIADFLDAETARIDTLVAKREAQQILLSQKGIAAAFTAIAGLNQPNERRASGLDWLGTIPAEWPVMAVGYQFEVLLGKMLNQGRARGDHLRTYLRNTNVQWDRIDTDDLLTMDFPPEEQNRYRVLPGDLLICEGGEPGRAAIWNGSVDEIYYQKALHRVRPRSYSSSRWLYYCMRAATAQDVFAIEGNTTTIAHLTGEQLRAHRFPFPPRPVQDKLTDELDSFQRQQNRLATQLARQQSLLGGRRQALITATVTGQIDVSTASGRGVMEEVSS